MPHYKDSENNVHFIENEKLDHLLPTGSVKITDAEADALRAPSLDELKTKRKDEIAAEANGLIDTQVGSSPRGQLMMVAKGLAMLDKQVGRGGNPSRDPKQDQLAAIFDYVEAVNANEQTAFDAIDTSVDAAAIAAVTLIEPPLPGA